MNPNPRKDKAYQIIKESSNSILNRKIELKLKGVGGRLNPTPIGVDIESGYL